MKVVVTAERGLNVRSCAGVTCRRVGALPRGTVVEVLERRGVWGRIASPLKGWLHTGYTRPVGENGGGESNWLPVDALDMSYYQRRLGGAFWNGAPRPWMVILKATQGLRILDARFGERWARLRFAGWRRAAYHFYEPDAPGLMQAKVFWEVTGAQPGELLALDFERFPEGMAKATVVKGVRDFLAYLADKSGSAPPIYTSAYVWNSVIGETDWARQYPLWVAHYTTAAAPSLPLGWERWALWQYGAGYWPGVSGKVDRNRVHRGFASAWEARWGRGE